MEARKETSCASFLFWYNTLMASWKKRALTQKRDSKNKELRVETWDDFRHNPYIDIFVRDTFEENMNYSFSGPEAAMTMNLEEAKAVLAALQEFVDKHDKK